MEVTATLAVLAIIVSVVSALFARKANQEARNSIRAQVITILTDLYFANEMYAAMTGLRKWEEENRNSFPDNFPPELEESRRHAKAYFLLLFRLREGKLINEGDEKALVHTQQLEFLLNIVAPIEKAKNEDLPPQDEQMYKHFKQLQVELEKEKEEREDG